MKELSLIGSGTEYVSGTGTLKLLGSSRCDLKDLLKLLIPMYIHKTCMQKGKMMISFNIVRVLAISLSIQSNNPPLCFPTKNPH